MNLVQASKRTKNTYRKLYIDSAGNELLALECNEKNLSLSCQNERKVKYHFVEESNISCISSSDRSSNISLVCTDICGDLCYYEANEALKSVIRAFEISRVYNLWI